MQKSQGPDSWVEFSLWELWSSNRSFCLESSEKLYTPPLLTPFLAKRHFSEEGGGGVYFEAPRGRNFIRPPLLYTPTPRRVFSGVGGWGCIKFGPVLNLERTEETKNQKLMERNLSWLKHNNLKLMEWKLSWLKPNDLNAWNGP